MNIYRSTDDIPPGIKPTAVTIGVFDGVHKGHQMLIRRVVELARETGATPGVVTFDRHPLEVVAPGKEPAMISTVEQRAEVLGGLGIEFVLVLTFDEQLRMLEPHEFVRQILVDGLGVTHVVVGSNFRFGYHHAGTVATLHDLGAFEGFGVDIFSLLGGQDAISSTLIRRQIAGGEVEVVAEELGRPFRLEGEVVRGAGRGKGLGVPTANLQISARMALPKLGVYAGWLTAAGRRRPAVVNVGLNPTFEDRSDPVVEVHVLDFDGDLYGKTVAIEFTHRLRDELKFDGPDPLVEQIRADIAQARALLGV
ncbi:MAG TPA: bifunctional riboflavin kinase/FAD synthetase [Actinomycetota bacterium]|nr:bifunctional riboflavin kinase/FAD synthetase [Actinomycetota bacterium]